MNSKLVCPVCNRSVATSPLKSWQFGRYEVKRYSCPSCKSRFNMYRSPTRTYTIPKPK